MFMQHQKCLEWPQENFLCKFCVKEETVTVQVNDDYVAGLENCEHHLHGRIVLNKGDKPLTHSEFCSKISKSSRFLVSWKEIHLGKEFYEFKF